MQELIIYIYSGEWKLFTGNQIGTVLGAACFEKAKASGIPIGKVIESKSEIWDFVDFYKFF